MKSIKYKAPRWRRGLKVGHHKFEKISRNWNTLDWKLISASATLLESFVSGITGIACFLRQHPFGCSETECSRWFLSGQCAAVSRAPQRPRKTKSVKDVCISCLARNVHYNWFDYCIYFASLVLGSLFGTFFNQLPKFSRTKCSTREYPLPRIIARYMELDFCGKSCHS